jgi:hypothetical protein
MHEITVREDGTITLADAAILCGVGTWAMHGRLKRGLLREVRREGYRILVSLMDVARTDCAIRRYGSRVPAEVSWRLEGEPDVDILAVFRVCQEVAAQAPPIIREPVVYYARFGERVKIGTTICPASRLPDIPHDEILAMEPGGAELEHERHMQFAEYWITGEWFRVAPPLLRHAADLAGEYPLPAA